MDLRAHSGRDTNLIVVLAGEAAANGPFEVASLASVAFRSTLLNASEQQGRPDPLGDYLEHRLDQLRDKIRYVEPRESIKEFQEFLATLPAGAPAVARMRAKANIGLRYLSLGDGETAKWWLDQAFQEAPFDPRAIAHKALAKWLGGEGQEAYEFGVRSLAADPTNVTLAAFLPQVAVALPHVGDPVKDIPAALRDNERVVAAEIMFLRGRGIVPGWWEKAHAAANRFPAVEEIAVLRAFADLDETTRIEEVRRTVSAPASKRGALAAAAVVLDRHWSAKGIVLTSRFSDGAHALAGAMVCYQLLHERDKALVLANRIGAEGLTDPQMLANAIQVALSYGAAELARRLVNLAPDDPDILFHGGIIAIQDGDWALAADRFSRANVPETEDELVETVLLLSKIKLCQSDAPLLEQVLEASLGYARSLTMVARVALDLGRPVEAQRAFRAAVETVSPDGYIAARLMVANLADEIGSPSDVIYLLDGHLSPDSYEAEQSMLARAHANERPHRERNLAYFERLSEAVRSRREIAVCYASVLTEIGRPADALPILRHLRKGRSSEDAFTLLLTVETLRRLKDERAVARLLASVDLTALVGTPRYRMGVIQIASAEQSAAKSYAAAYDLVRSNPADSEVVLGYSGLGLVLIQDNPAFAPPRMVETGTFVAIEAGDQERKFIIDEGTSFFGRDLETPQSATAQLVLGKRVGDSFAIPRPATLDDEVWTIKEIRSKYLDLHLRIMDEFEVRYPGAPGIWKVQTRENDVQPFLEVIRRTADANQKLAEIYMQGKAPLGVVAKALGGDPITVAPYIRSIGGEIRTCRGSAEERNDALQQILEARVGGAVLDPFTAFTAAEMRLLPQLRAFFGELRVPDSTLEMIDCLLEKQRTAVGKKMMSIAWHNGQFFREEYSDDFRHAQISHLERERASIVEHCRIDPVILPNQLTEAATIAIDLGGSRYMDAAFLAHQYRCILISEDMLYRDLAIVATNCNATWLQATLMAATDENTLTLDEYALATSELAIRRHSHVSISGPVLFKIYLYDDEALTRLHQTLHYLAGADAEMVSNYQVLSHFLAILWSRPVEGKHLKREAATGATLAAYFRYQGDQSRAWLRRLASDCRDMFALRSYMDGWLRGHFTSF